MRLTLTRPEAVIFDMDGLLLDSESLCLRLLAQAAAELNMPWDHDIGLQMVGLNLGDSSAVLKRAHGDDYEVAALRAKFDEYYEASITQGEIPLKPFVRELIHRLASLKIPMAVATSTHRVRAEAKLQRAELMTHFKALACGDEITRGKPSPEIFELAARRIGVRPSGCLVLEDSNAGIRGAVAANMKAVMVPDLLRPDADIRRLGVQVAESLRDVIAAIPS